MTVVVPDLSLIVLAFNEQENLAKFLEETLAWLDTQAGNHEVIVVDDGSTDDTRAVAQAVSDRDKRVHVVSHPHNRGMGAGMRTGIASARGTYFTVLAADGQVSASALETLLPQLGSADIVLSTYSRRPSERHRVLLSWGLRALMRVALQVKFQLEGIYLFPVAVARDEIGAEQIRSDTFFFSFELITRAIAKGHTVKTVVIEPRSRQQGTSKVANLSRILRVAGELTRLRLRLWKEALSPDHQSRGDNQAAE